MSKMHTLKLAFISDMFFMTEYLGKTSKIHEKKENKYEMNHSQEQRVLVPESYVNPTLW